MSRAIYVLGLVLTGLAPVLMFLAPVAALFAAWGAGTALLLLSHWWERGGEVRGREGRRRVCRCDCHVHGGPDIICGCFGPCCALPHRKYLHRDGRMDWHYYNRLRRELPRLGWRTWVRCWMRFLFGWAGYGRLPRFKKFTFPIVKRIPYGALANEIIAVQPMTAAAPNHFVHTAQDREALRTLGRELGYEEEE
jgi:hypothetical protein